MPRRVHDAPLHSTLSAVPWWNNPAKTSSSSRDGTSAGGQKIPAVTPAATPSAHRRAAVRHVAS